MGIKAKKNRKKKREEKTRNRDDEKQRRRDIEKTKSITWNKRLNSKSRERKGERIN